MLKSENAKLKALLVPNTSEPIGKLVTKLYDDEEYFSIKIPEIIENDPDKFRFTMLDDIKSTIGFYGTTRRALLKSAFRLIIETIIPDYVKPYFLITTFKPLSKVLQIMRTSIRTSKTYKFK